MTRKTTAKKTVKKVAAKRGRPRKETKTKDVGGYAFDPDLHLWTREANFSDLSSLLSNLSIRVTHIERKIEEAERAGAKVQADLEQWRKYSAPKWKSRQPSDGKPNVSHAKVLVMYRDGKKEDMPRSVDSLHWGELGDSTIIAYAVV